MGDWRCKNMSQLKHVACPVCEKGILTVVAEVGVEAYATTAMFQSLSAAQGRVYRCDNCGKSFVKVDDVFLELIYSKNRLVLERLEPQKKKVIEEATIVKKPRETKHKAFVCKRGSGCKEKTVTETPK
jgi:hypothetical protein